MVLPITMGRVSSRCHVRGARVGKSTRGVRTQEQSIAILSRGLGVFRGGSSAIQTLSQLQTSQPCCEPSPFQKSRRRSTANWLTSQVLYHGIRRFPNHLFLEGEVVGEMHM